ncbi:peroxiredoxin family protein [Desulfosudis oleivorans]|uniref:Alkyl hydroperoxide reductase/ Thiol specific antioxidant/ Mal allergen n=1 Tax=Desulfosudis oleivorans (strain DSM 6200 / JCM 39069 / Hxd3) TaxID=96561 RepID=A8ZYX7_DESOH|nr:redoxin domain-containing protein [Desulfosudis oleivorans]ABW68750.1 alkyl hydroperoxide reductase/ Thiol specific antioxidant/ Mal allergen [Desulfosudis oleivorans Hxd3]
MKKLSTIPVQLSIACAVILLSLSTARAQEIHLHVPHFAGSHYEWKIFQGKQELTVRSGEISPDGRVILTMPDPYQDYRGMTRWLLKKGGGLDMIYTGKGFSVECLSEKPNSDNIIYTGNPENDYLESHHSRQQTILGKLGAVNHLLQVYAPDENLHKIALDEQTHLRQAFSQVQADRAESLLYAARFGKIVDFTKGIADKIYDNPEDHTTYFNDFVTHTLDFKDLYTSGHWDQVLHHWVMMNIRSGKGDHAFIERMESAMSRMNQDNILAAFAEKAVPLLVEKGKDDLLPAIADHLENRPAVQAALSGSVKNMMASVKMLTGKKAPDLVFHAPVRTQTKTSAEDIIIKTGNLDAAHTILLFYQGECPLCENTLIDLANKYQQLKEQNVRVIAISADMTDQGFEDKLIYHQWPDNYCDFTGMAVENFTKYGVLGVPTLFLLNQEGVVVKKTAMMDELMEILDKKKPF